jgi:hypothetical protein
VKLLARADVAGLCVRHKIDERLADAQCGAHACAASSARFCIAPMSREGLPPVLQKCAALDTRDRAAREMTLR